MYNVKFPLLFYGIQFTHVFWELFSVNNCPIYVYFSERLTHGLDTVGDLCVIVVHAHMQTYT